jgi:8-oxo-dGTP diphosphatase
MPEPRRFTVVAAVIRDDRGSVLLTQRPEGRHMAGLWEFPGGKVHANEGPEAALVRELREELGIEAKVLAPITFAVHREPELEILLLFWEATILSGPPRPLDGQEIAWVPPAELPLYPTPPADAGLVAALSEKTSD